MSNAERQAAFRARREAALQELEELRAALARACGRGRSARVTNGLPEAPTEWIAELTRRLERYSLVAHGVTAPRAKSRRRRPGQLPFVRFTRPAPCGRGTVTIYDGQHLQSRWSPEGMGGRWIVVCDVHGTEKGFRDLALARRQLRGPECCQKAAGEAHGTR